MCSHLHPVDADIREHLFDGANLALELINIAFCGELQGVIKTIAVGVVARRRLQVRGLSQVITMTEASTHRDEWLEQIEKSIKVKAGDRWKSERWSEFLKEVVWWLHNEMERDDDDTIDAAVGLITYGIKTKEDLIDAAENPPNSEAFNRKLKTEGVLPAICDKLFKKYVARQSSTGVETIPEHMVPVLLTLAVNSMKSGWEKISSECTKSESSTARNNSVSHYGLQSERTCQILGRNTAHVQNAHIWPHNNSPGLVLVELQPSDIAYYLDRFQLTFVLSGSDFIL